jgi:hypothetical protein
MRYEIDEATSDEATGFLACGGAGWTATERPKTANRRCITWNAVCASYTWLEVELYRYMYV